MTERTKARVRTMATKTEILVPAGDRERFEAALMYGADAIYLGAKSFGMRANPANFGFEELGEAVRAAHERGVKVYLTCNTLPSEDELPQLEDFLLSAKGAGVDALIVADLGVLSHAKRVVPDMEIHMSTQTGIVNSAACNFLWEQGVKRAVLARELSLEEIKEIRKNIPCEMELEVFVHGAMCVSFSGRCLISAYMTDRDANRGMCAQPCRWKYALMEEKRPGVYFPVEEDSDGTYFFNAKDMCMIDHLKEVIDAGVTSLKIEGRAKSSYYTAVTANAYKTAKLFIERGEAVPQWVKDEVYKCSHRQYCTGFFYGYEPPTQNYETAGYEREYDVVAVVDSCEDGRVYCTQRNRFFPGDEVEILEPGKEPVKLRPEHILNEKGEEVEAVNHSMMKFSFADDRVYKSGAFIRKKADE